jgi:hypothetical protein
MTRIIELEVDTILSFIIVTGITRPNRELLSAAKHRCTLSRTMVASSSAFRHSVRKPCRAVEHRESSLRLPERGTECSRKRLSAG